MTVARVEPSPCRRERGLRRRLSHRQGNGSPKQSTLPGNGGVPQQRCPANQTAPGSSSLAQERGCSCWNPGPKAGYPRKPSASPTLPWCRRTPGSSHSPMNGSHQRPLRLPCTAEFSFSVPFSRLTSVMAIVEPEQPPRFKVRHRRMTERASTSGEALTSANVHVDVASEYVNVPVSGLYPAFAWVSVVPSTAACNRLPRNSGREST